jgi:twitching motility protein PilT
MKLILTRSSHILTIEDPIEYVYPPGKSIVSQRENGNVIVTRDGQWHFVLALREDPDVLD